MASSNTEIILMNNNNTNNNENAEDSCNNIPSKFAVHVRHDKRKKFFTRATSAKISVREFFDFIKTAYQVNESLEQFVPELLLDNNTNSTTTDGSSNCNTNTSVNWNKLANNQLISQLINDQNKILESNKKEIECQTLISDDSNNNNNNNNINNDQTIIKKQQNHQSSQLSINTNNNNDTKSTSLLNIKQSNINIIHDMMDETISEGLLDKVLPYLTPNDLILTTQTQPIIKKHTNNTVIPTGASGTSTTTSASSTSGINNGSGDHKKSSNKHHHGKTTINTNNIVTNTTKLIDKKDDLTINSNNNLKPSLTSITTTEPEVEIHVCDEVKHLKKDFRCPQSLLVSKMGYFAEITAGQRLEDIDISVHCDINIFDWLMRWTKKDIVEDVDQHQHQPQQPQPPPQLESTCVAPILVSAVFLQMDPLIEECLLFCHEHMNDVLKTSTNLSCLNDVIITRLAAMYTNTELELIKDKKDKIISRLYCKLILSLGEPVAQSIRGHWSTLAGIYKCSKCLKLIINNDKISKNIQCVPSQMYVSAIDGEIISEHVRDINWNLSEYIVQVYHELKTWRKVYWRLWSVCHYLKCLQCLQLFPIHQISWCCSHPEQPQFFITEVENKMNNTTGGTSSVTIPVGRYSCCGARTYRFEVLTNTSHGCQFKEHLPDVKHPRDLAILSIFNQHRQVIEQPPPEIMIPERLTKLVARDTTNECNKLLNNKEVLWWEGIELAPNRQKLGLLGKMCFIGRYNNNNTNKETSTYYNNNSYYNDNTNEEYYYSSSEYSSDDDDNDNIDDEDSESTTDNNLNNNKNNSLNDASSSTTSDNDDNINDNNQIQQQQYRTELSLNLFNFKHRYNYEQKRKRRNRRSWKHHGGTSGIHGANVANRHHHHRHRHYRRNHGGNVGRYWSPNLSARSNQDLQRDFEETAMQQITDFLSRRTAGVVVVNNCANILNNTNNTTNNYSSSTSTLLQQKQSINNKIQYSNIWNHHLTPIGGIYQRLEGEWNELNRQSTSVTSSSYHQTNKHNKSSTISATSSYIVKPKLRVHRNN